MGKLLMKGGLIAIIAIVALFLLVFGGPIIEHANADSPVHVTCYSGGHAVYDENVKNVQRLDGQRIRFTDPFARRIEVIGMMCILRGV